MIDPRTQKILNFLKEAEKLKLVERINYLSDQQRRENDAEHSWHLALFLMCLEREPGIDFDMERALKMAALHDMVEIETGDGWVTDHSGKQEKKAREIAAAKKVFSSLPEDMAEEFFSLWREYDEGKTAESKILKALDKTLYHLQYSVSQRIEWDRPTSHEESREYAMPHLEFNQKIIDMFEHLMAETPAKFNPEEKK